MNLIDGRVIADELLKSAQRKVESNGLKPRLDIIWIGDNPRSETYVQKKKNAGEQIGVTVEVHHYQEISEDELLNLTRELNARKDVNGIIIQLPVPDIDPHKAFAEISPVKDVDGLNPISLGKLWQKQNILMPATVRAIWLVLEYIAAQESMSHDLLLEGKHVLIINRSDIIGKPLAAVLLAHNCTVTIAHSKTADLYKLISTADIIISGTGKNGIVSADNVKKSAIVIDVGFTKNESTVSGDIDTETFTEKVNWLSPVPNGIGPVGVAALIDNTVDAALMQS